MRLGVRELGPGQTATGQESWRICSRMRYAYVARTTFYPVLFFLSLLLTSRTQEIMHTCMRVMLGFDAAGFVF